MIKNILIIDIINSWMEKGFNNTINNERNKYKIKQN